MKLEKAEALELVLELIRTGKLALPSQQKYSAGRTAPSYDAVIDERARVEARYLKRLLEELLKKDE